MTLTRTRTTVLLNQASIIAEALRLMEVYNLNPGDLEMVLVKINEELEKRGCNFKYEAI